jgi:hypothetical protein
MRRQAVCELLLILAFSDVLRMTEPTWIETM